MSAQSPFWKSILVPTPGQAVLSLGTSCVVLGVVFRQAIAERFISGTGISQDALGQVYGQQLGLLNQIEFAQLAVVTLFWAGVGLAAYLVYGIIAQALSSAITGLAIERSYVNQGRSNFRRPLHRLKWGAVLLIFLAVSIKWMFPVWLRLFSDYLISQHLVAADSLLPGGGAVLGLAANCYLLWMAVYLTVADTCAV